MAQNRTFVPRDNEWYPRKFEKAVLCERKWGYFLTAKHADWERWLIHCADNRLPFIAAYPKPRGGWVVSAETLLARRLFRWSRPMVRESADFIQANVSWEGEEENRVEWRLTGFYAEGVATVSVHYLCQHVVEMLALSELHRDPVIVEKSLFLDDRGRFRTSLDDPDPVERLALERAYEWIAELKVLGAWQPGIEVVPLVEKEAGS